MYNVYVFFNFKCPTHVHPLLKFLPTSVIHRFVCMYTSIGPTFIAILLGIFVIQKHNAPKAYTLCSDIFYLNLRYKCCVELSIILSDPMNMNTLTKVLFIPVSTKYSHSNLLASRQTT